MFNEDTVAERIIKHSCLIDYPLDKLEIQVLDDSTDHSADIAKKAVDEWAAKGYPIKYIHRADRKGYKAGALAEAMKEATGEYIAIFDADFIPPRDMLKNVVNYFTDDKIGMVQVRWDHLNRDASLLTKSQAIFLDGHFVIEHTARNRSGRFMHFNGTAGVWRRSCIDDGGGWEHDTLTEDLDLSYRCQMKGWQFVYLPQFCAPAELPPEMIAFKQQAHRWTKGSFQTAIKLLAKVLRSKHLSYAIKTEAFFHLTNTLVYPLMVLLTLMIYPIFYMYAPTIPYQAPLKPGLHHDPDWGSYIFSASLFVLATCSASTFFVFGQRELFGKKTGWKTILYLPFLMALGRRRGAEQRPRGVRGDLERDQEEAQRVRPHAEVRRHGHRPQEVAPRARLHAQARLSAHSRDRDGRLHDDVHLDQRHVADRPHQHPLPADLRRRVLLRGLRLAPHALPDEPRSRRDRSRTRRRRAGVDVRT
jgi:cellulose synthase/poly-beta-1,6-N-acetylglucosamine synthase-like glycosyltransferase